MQKIDLNSLTTTPASSSGVSGALVRVGPFELLLDTNLLKRDGKTLNVGSRAIGVLRCLAARPGQTVSKQVLLQEAWIDESGHKLVVETGSLQVQIHNLRKAMGRDAIKTVMDRGYQLSLPVSVPTSAPPSFPVPNLVEPLIGRDGDDSLLRQVLSDHRLVTLIGAGGVGKTSLATKVASSLDSSSTHWISLAPLTSNDELIRIIAAATRSEVSVQAAETSADSLARAMRNFSGLLVLDNAEHLIDLVRALVAAALAHAPQARFLITSQVPLRVSGEQVYPLQPLATPNLDASSAELVANAGVRLFFKSARMGTPSDADVALVKMVGRITRALNGNPLAIHLIAAHAQALDLETLDGPVERLFDLTSVRTDQPLRQHSLSDAFDWSLRLLDDDAKRVFHLLAQFPGGISSRILALAAANLGFEFVRVIALVSELLDRSLVFRANPTARIVVPEAARHYSIKLVEANGTREWVERAFIDIMTQQARNCEHTFWFSPSAFWRAEFMPEAENVRAAFLLAAERRYDDPIALLGLAVRHAWAEDGLSPTPLGLRDVMTAERLQGALARDAAAYQIFNALGGLHTSIWGTIQDLEAQAYGFSDKEHNLWLGLAYIGECIATANFDLAHAKICRARAAEHLPELEATPVVLQFMMTAKGLVLQASGELDAAQEVFDRRVMLSEECSTGIYGMAVTDALDCAWRRKDIVRIMSAWEQFLADASRIGQAGRVGLLSIWIHAFSTLSDLARASEAFRRLRDIVQVSNVFEPWTINSFACFALACGDPALAADIMAKGEHLEARGKLHRARVNQEATADILAQIDQNFLRAARDRTLPITLNEMLRRCAAHADRILENQD